MVEIVVNPIIPADRDRWAELWRGYLDFYETRLPPEIYEHTWQRLTAADSPIHGLGARLGSRTAPLIGIVHYLFHAHAWTTQEVCYLQDLFVDGAVRRSGCGRMLIEAVRGGTRPWLLPALLDDKGGQRHGAIALRPDRPVQRLHPLRLRAGIAM